MDVEPDGAETARLVSFALSLENHRATAEGFCQDLPFAGLALEPGDFAAVLNYDNVGRTGLTDRKPQFVGRRCLRSR